MKKSWKTEENQGFEKYHQKEENIVGHILNYKGLFLIVNEGTVLGKHSRGRER